MHRQMLTSKIHRATVTACDPDDRNEFARVASHPEVLLDSPLAPEAVR